MDAWNSNNGEVLCPRCKVPMEYRIEVESLASGEKRITRYYKCPVCGTIIIDEKYAIKPDNGTIKIINLTNGQKKIIYSRVQTRPRRPPRTRR